MPVRHRRRHFILAALAAPLALAGCGFKMRGPQPMRFSTIHLGVDPYSPFGAELRREIEASGSTRVVDTPAEADVRLDIIKNDQDREILSLAGDGSVREYQISRSIVFRVRSRAGRDLIPASTISARREYDFNDAQIIAKQREETLLFRDMERDLMQQLVRRLAALRP